MSQVILDEALAQQITNGDAPTELCNPEGKVIAVALSPEEYRRLLYDVALAESATPEAEAERQESLAAYRRGDCLTTAQLRQAIRDAGFDTELR